MGITCRNCGLDYSEHKKDFRCPKCGTLNRPDKALEYVDSVAYAAPTYTRSESFLEGMTSNPDGEWIYDTGNSPHLVKGIIVTGANMLTTIDEVYSGRDCLPLGGSVPAVLFQIGLSLEMIQRLVKEEQTIVLNPAINLRFPTIERHSIFTIRTSGQIDTVSIFGVRILP